MVVVLSDDADPRTSFTDVHDLDDSSDVVCHTAAGRRLILATLSYHAVRATRRQQGPLAYGRALSIARAVMVAHTFDLLACMTRCH